MRILSTALALMLLASCSGPHMSSPHEGSPVANPAQLLLNDLDGMPHDASQFLAKGEPVVLVFWQTWCASCIREAPAIAAAARRYEPRMHFYGVIPGSDEYVDEGKVRDMSTKLGLPYPNCRDRDGVLTQRFGVKGTPTIVVLGRQGEVLFEGHHPPADWSAFLN